MCVCVCVQANVAELARLELTRANAEAGPHWSTTFSAHVGVYKQPNSFSARFGVHKPPTTFSAQIGLYKQPNTLSAHFGVNKLPTTFSAHFGVHKPPSAPQVPRIIRDICVSSCKSRSEGLKCQAGPHGGTEPFALGGSLRDRVWGGRGRLTHDI